jgi:hypothetical protein
MMFALVQKGHKWDNGMRPDVTTILRATRPECEAELAAWIAAGQTGLRIKPSPPTALEVSLAKRKALMETFR